MLGHASLGPLADTCSTRARSDPARATVGHGRLPDAIAPLFKVDPLATQAQHCAHVQVHLVLGVGLLGAVVQAARVRFVVLGIILLTPKAAPATARHMDAVLVLQPQGPHATEAVQVDIETVHGVANEQAQHGEEGERADERHADPPVEREQVRAAVTREVGPERSACDGVHAEHPEKQVACRLDCGLVEEEQVREQRRVPRRVQVLGCT